MHFFKCNEKLIVPLIVSLGYYMGVKHTPRLLICGNYGATNIGDEAILQSIFQVVASTFPHAHIQVASANPALTTQQYKVETVEKIPAGLRSLWKAIFSRSLKRTLTAYRSADAVIFGGGGLFTDERPHAIFIWLLQILPAFWYKKPVLCFGQSVGPLMTRWSRFFVKKIFKGMKIVTVRDEASQLILHKMGVGNIHVLPDPVFGLYIANIKHTHHSDEHYERKPYIVLSLRPWIKNSEKHHKIVAEFVDWLFDTYHIKTFFVPFQSAQDDDEKELLRVFSKLGHRDAAEVLAHNEKTEDVLKLMKHATAVVGMRLHSLIFSTITHTPFLALSYSLKVVEVVRQLGMDNYLSEYRTLNLEDLKKKFELLYGHRSDLENALAEGHKELEQKAEAYADLLKNLL